MAEVLYYILSLIMRLLFISRKTLQGTVLNTHWVSYSLNGSCLTTAIVFDFRRLNFTKVPFAPYYQTQTSFYSDRRRKGEGRRPAGLGQGCKQQSA